MLSGAIVAAAMLLVGADDAKTTRLTTDGHFKQRPAWSPDGTWLSFTRHQGASIFLYLRSADGALDKRLTTRDAPEFEAVWSLDGKRLAFCFAKTGPNQVDMDAYPI